MIRTESQEGAASRTATEEAPESLARELQGFVPKVGSRELVVLLHAYRCGPESLRGIQKIVTDFRPGADLYLPSMPTGIFSFADPVEIAAGLLRDLDHLDGMKGVGGYDQITLIGHSLGGLLARKLYICARGENGDAPFEPGLTGTIARPWADRVDRIILLAGMNRGWSISHHLSFSSAVIWTIGTWILSTLSWIRSVIRMLTLGLLRPREPLVFTVLRGAPFITQLRIQWLSMVRHARPNAQNEGIKLAPTIQLLGSIDDMVSPNDNIDLVTGRDFVYLDVPKSGHANVVEMDDTPEGIGRREVLQEALNESPEMLREKSLQPGDLQVTENEAIKHVIFVIHGIRDEGFWTQKIARKAMTLWKKQSPSSAPNFASITSSYGYFPMLSFLFPSRRLQKVQWLMDQYTEALARYPNAHFYFVGHSHGTYLLARALQDNPSCHFSRVVFAGSVVRTGFDWAKFQASRTLPKGKVVTPQVGPVLNYVATRDRVVAYFPKVLEMFRLQDLGSAGHDGFKQFKQNPPKAYGKQIEFIRGRHSTAIKEANWLDIADFIVEGNPPQSTGSQFAGSRFPLTVLLGWVSPLVWIFLFALAIGIGKIIMCSIGDCRPFWQGAALVGYIWLVIKILMTV